MAQDRRKRFPWSDPPRQARPGKSGYRFEPKAWLRSFVASADEIEQREEINPNNIHEMPIKAGNFHAIVIFRRDFPDPRQNRHDTKQADADDHVQGMQAGHKKVKTHE